MSGLADGRHSARAAARGSGVARWRRLLDGLGWNRVYGAVSYLRSALWLAPIAAIVLGLTLFQVLAGLEDWITRDLTGLSVTGARALFQTIVTLNLSFLIFTFGSLLVAIQIASGQLTPRIIATTLLQDRVIKYTVGFNVFTMQLSIAGLNRTDEVVHQLLTLVAICLGIASLASFLYLIDYAARLLRPVRIVALVSDSGVKVIRSVYPEEGEDEPGEVDSTLRASLGVPARIVTHEGRSNVVLAVDLGPLVAEAARLDGVVEFVPRIGDFVAADEPLFHLYGAASGIEDPVLHGTVAFGAERTMEQDPMFAFRILVDIALKALSPAINDPTTAILAMDQIHRLLRFVGKRRLHGEAVCDESGEVRLLLRTPNWGDFVDISCNEIRACGANNVQIARRSRAMLENLIRTLPAQRHAALRQQLDLLDRTLPEHYRLAEDLALARIPDPQGLGGGSATHPSTPMGPEPRT